MSQKFLATNYFTIKYFEILELVMRVVVLHDMWWYHAISQRCITPHQNKKALSPFYHRKYF